MKPQGNMGESRLPPNRPRFVMAFIPETPQMKHDSLELNRGLVIDARLRPEHTLSSVQSVLMAACKTEIPFPLTHMEGPQYLLLLPTGADRHHFILNHEKSLLDLGYVTYPWTPTINGFALRLRFKIWIALTKMSPLAWTIDHLVSGMSSFGVVLDHAPMNKVNSLEEMYAVVAVTDLELIPQSIIMWIRGIGRPVGVKVISWLEEALPLNPPLDTTPTEAFFDKVRTDNLKAITGYEGSADGKGLVAIQFEDLIGLWENLEGSQKEKIEKTLKLSPLFEPYVRAKNAKVSEKGAEALLQNRVHGDETGESYRKGKAKVSEQLEISDQVRTGGGKRIRSNEKPILRGSGSGSVKQNQIRTMEELENYLFNSPPKEKIKSINSPKQGEIRSKNILDLNIDYNPNESPFQLPPDQTGPTLFTKPFPIPTPITDHALGLDRNYSRPIIRLPHPNPVLKLSPISTPTYNKNRTGDEPHNPINLETESDTNQEINEGAELLSEDEPNPLQVEDDPMEEEPIEIDEEELEAEPIVMDFENGSYELDFNDPLNQAAADPIDLDQGGSNSEVSCTVQAELGFPPGFESYSARQTFVNELAAMEREIELQDQRDAIESARGEDEHETMAAAAAELDAALAMAAAADAESQVVAAGGPIMAEAERATDAESVPTVAHQVMPHPPPTIRKSARLQGKSPVKTYSTKRKKNSKEPDEGEASIKDLLTDSDLVKSIEAEVLESNPLQEEKVARIDKYCGTLNMPSEDEEVNKEVERASVLEGINLDSDDDLTDEDEDGDAE